MAFVYIAARTSDADTVSRIISKLVGIGYAPSLDWTGLEVPKPYIEHDCNRKTATDMVNAVRNSDLLVILADDGGYGSMVEFGVALSSNVRCIVLLPSGVRQSVFFCHPLVSVTDCIEEVIALAKNKEQ